MSSRMYAIPLALLVLTGCASGPVVNKSAETYFKEGEQQYAQKNYEEAIAHWKKVKESYFSPELTTMAELNIADAQFENGNYIEAAASYEDFRKLHPAHPKAAYALFRQGMSYFNQIEGVDTDQIPVKNATTTFESFLRQYPSDQYADEVREKLRSCEEKLFQHEIYVGRFYLRTEKYEAAIQRLVDALAKYPRNRFADEAYFYLGQSYLLAGHRQKGREAFARLTDEFSESPYLVPAKKFLEKYY